MPGCTIQPASTLSDIVLPSTGTFSEVTGCLPIGVYNDNTDFISGAVDQVAFSYRMLAGDQTSVELTACQVYAAYEYAVLEYSAIVNMHQAKNTLHSLLGDATGTFDHDGDIKSGSALYNEHIELKYPKFQLGYVKRVAQGLTHHAHVGGVETIYSASIDVTDGVQDYDLQEIISAMPEFSSSVDNQKILIHRTYFKSPRAMWRFFGYFGGLSAVGNLSTYGQYADDSTFEVIPTWQNKLQALAYEDSFWTRTSHYSFKIINNNLRIYPIPSGLGPDKVWVEFSIPTDAWQEDVDSTIGVNGINNVNTAPFENIPYENINSIGKHWIRQFAFARAKEVLGHSRGKWTVIPVPGESYTLNYAELYSQGKTEMEQLRQQLRDDLKELEYKQLVKNQEEIAESTNNVQKKIPLLIYRG